MNSWWHYWHAHLLCTTLDPAPASQHLLSSPCFHKDGASPERSQARELNTNLIMSLHCHSCRWNVLSWVGCQAKQTSLSCLIPCQQKFSPPTSSWVNGAATISIHLHLQQLWGWCSTHCSTSQCWRQGLRPSLLPVELELFEQTGPMGHFSLRHIVFYISLCPHPFISL